MQDSDQTSGWDASDCIVSYDADGNVMIRFRAEAQGSGLMNTAMTLSSPALPESTDEGGTEQPSVNEDTSGEVDHCRLTRLHGVWRVTDQDDDQQPIEIPSLVHTEKKPQHVKREPFGIFHQPEEVRSEIRKRVFDIPTIPRPKILRVVSDRLEQLERHPDKRVRRTYEVGRFGVTFASAFTVLFLALNFGSYFQIMKASLLPDSNKEARLALTLMTNPILREELLNVPELPIAGPKRLSLPFPDVMPPDFRLVIPSMGKNVPIVNVSDDALKRQDWTTFKKDVEHGLRFGVVHYPGTAVPGQIGNVFLTGHSSYQPWDPGRYKDVFALLPTLKIGDEYFIIWRGRIHRYRIVDKFEVKPNDISVLDQPRDMLMSTLMTCTPVGTNINRMILIALQLNIITGEFLTVTEPIVAQEEAEWGSELMIW